MIIFFCLFAFASALSLKSQDIRHDLASHKNWKLVNTEDCGQSYSDRIIGGREASLGQYPWMAQLQYELRLRVPGSSTFTKLLDSYDCGGTVINERYILTAAHCNPEHLLTKVQSQLKQLGIGNDNLEYHLSKVRLGEHNTKTDPDCMNGVCAPKVQDIDVEEYECHKEYNSATFQNDICLIRLTNPIEFTDFVDAICLPVYSSFLGSNFTNTSMEVAGWGIMDIVSKRVSDTLQTLRVPVTQDCPRFYSPRGYVIGRHQLCAGGQVGEDSCGGDSGGPLMRTYSVDAAARYFLVGIVSFGLESCGSSEAPGVYTRVAEYMPWLLDTMRE